MPSLGGTLGAARAFIGMPPTFLRTSVQLAQVLRTGILERTWIDRMPGERLLADRFQVSRKTVRAALAELRAEGLLATRHGAGTTIRLPAARRRGRPRQAAIGLLLRQPLADQRQHTALWIGKLADMLHRIGYRLEIFSGQKYYVQSGGRALAALTRSNPLACWVVGQSTQFVQRWFAASGLSVVIAGALHAGVELPSVDLDHAGLCRHAAGVLLRAGHRRIALLYARTSRAGDLESEEGFRQGCRRAAEVTPLIVQHGDTADSVYQAMHRLMTSARPPTGLLVTNSYSYLTAASYLAAQGRRIPQDVSLLSRDDDAFLHHLRPVPDCYHVNPEKFARQVKQAVLATLRGGMEHPVAVRIVPEYRRAGSVAAPA